MLGNRVLEFAYAEESERYRSAAISNRHHARPLGITQERARIDRRIQRRL